MFLRSASRRAPSEAVQHSFRPARIDLEDRSQARGAAGRCRPVEISGTVQNQASVRDCAVWPSEGVQHGLGIACIQLEYNSESGVAAGGRSAVDVARRVLDQHCGGQPTVHTRKRVFYAEAFPASALNPGRESLRRSANYVVLPMPSRRSKALEGSGGAYEQQQYAFHVNPQTSG